MAAIILPFPTTLQSRSAALRPRTRSLIDSRLRKALGILTMITDAVDGIEDSRTVDALYAVQDLLIESKALIADR